MRKLFGAGLALLSLSLWSGAYAQTITRGWVSPAVASSPSGPCAFGTDPVADGCSTATPGAKIQFANFLTSGVGGALKSGQVYVIPQNHNLTCIDFACGHYTADASLVDPTVTIPAGCFVCTPTEPRGCSSPDITNGYVLECDGDASGNTSLLHLSFKAINGHGPGALDFKHVGLEGTVTIDDITFGRDASCNAPLQAEFIKFEAGTTHAIVASNFDMDGGDAACRYIAPIGGIIFSGGSKTISRFYLGNLSYRAVNFVGGNSTTDVMKWGLIDCYGTIPQSGHNEIGLFSDLAGQTYNSFTMLDVTINTCSRSAATGTAPLFLTNGSSTAFGAVLIDGFYSIVNTVDGAPSSPLTGTLNVTIAGAPNSAGNAVLTVNSISSGILHEGTEVIGNVDSFDVFPMVKLSGTGGAGSTFSVACGPNNLACPAGFFTTSSSALIPSTSYSAQAGTWGNWTMSVTGAEAGGASYVSLTIRNSQIDTTAGAIGWVWRANADATCTTPASFSGNTSLLTGGALNGWTANASASC